MRARKSIFLLMGWVLVLIFSMSFSALGQTDSPADGLAIVNFLPADGTEQVEADATITVIFNRPVVPLGLTSDSGLVLPDPLIFTPTVAGTGEWVNTAIYQFQPEPALGGGVAYTVTVDPALTAIDGTMLSGTFSSSFTTAAPLVINFVPGDTATRVPLDQTVQIRFNQPMDRASVESSFRLLPIDGGSALAGTFEWADDDAGFRFIPSQPLELNSSYTVSFSPDAGLPVGANGGAPLAGVPPVSFSTIPLPAILNTYPGSGAPDAYPYGGFTIYFASPMDIDSLEGKIQISPEPWRDYDSYYSEYDDSYTLSFPTEPSTDYTITLLAGMLDLYGNAINETTVINYRTQRYDAELLLDTQGDFGFYNAGNDATRLFLRHRNVQQVDLELYRLTPDDLIGVLTGDNRYQGTLGDNFALTPQNRIKSWTIPSVAPENAMRYEYLDLGTTAVDACDGAPPSRVNMGDVIRVITQPDPLRVRSAPRTGEILTTLTNGTTLPIVGGPNCAGNFTWWQVTLNDGRTGWVAEGDQTEYYVEVESAATRIPVEVTDAEGNALAPGVYFLRAAAQEISYQREHVLIVGTANLTMKIDTDSVLVWATDATTGASLANLPVTVYGANLNPLASGVTGADGLLQTDIPRLENLYQSVVAVANGADHFGVSATEWSSGIEGYSFGYSTEAYPAPYTTYVYTDRPVYRPGQPVYYRGVLRLKDDVTYTVPPLNTLTVRIFDPENNIVGQEEVTVTPDGTFSAQFDIAADAALGYYRIDPVLPEDDPENLYDFQGVVQFGVAEYRLPEFQVTVTPDADEVAVGDTISVTIDSRYYFGGVVNGATVSYSVIAAPSGFNYEGAGNYNFIDYDADGSPSEFYSAVGGLITSGEGVTDERGQLVVTFAADLGEARQSLEFTLEATVTDESGQAVSGRTPIIVHQGALYIGVAPEEYVGTADAENTFNLIAVDWQGQPIAEQAIDLEFVERRWSSVQERDAEGRTTWTYEVEEIPVATSTVTTDVNGRAVAVFTPPTGGVYKLKATARDSAGREVISATTTWVSDGAYVPWRMQNSNRIDLIADKTDYVIGDTAEILIASPFQGATEALVTVERGDILYTERLTLTTNSTVYRLPILPEYAPNAYISVLIVKGVDETNPVAAFRMGMVGFNVELDRRVIALAIVPDTEQAGPGDTVTYTVTATDYQGAPVQGEIGVALTDLASLSIADANQIDILSYFYGLQSLGVRTSTALTINVDQLTQETLDTIKGGGGGFGEGGIFDIREDFVDTAYWNGSVTTDANGVATFSVTLPDNLTTWRLDARAIGTSAGAPGLLVGSATQDLLSTKPLLIRPVTPRFFVVGDEVSLAAVVNNNTATDLIVDVTLSSVAGVTFLDERGGQQTLNIPAGGRQRVDFPVRLDLVTPEQTGVDLLFTAVDTTGTYADASVPVLGDEGVIPLLRYEVPETVGTAGMISAADSRTEGIVLPTDLPITTGELRVELEPSLAVTTVDALDYLENFPYQCIEQTVSRFLPNIMTTRALQRLGIDDPTLIANLNRSVDFAMQPLYAQQKPDGGWGWYVQDPSNPLTTAYALIGLSEAQNNGFAVSADVISAAQNFLRGSFITPSVNTPMWQINRQAFVLYALARSGVGDVARTATLFENRERLAYYGRALLALTFDALDPADTRADTLLSDLVNAATLSASGASWTEAETDFYNWNTDTRTTALALAAFLKITPDNELIPNIVRYLVSQRTADAWETTQETAWSVMALTDYMVATNDISPQYDYSVTLNGGVLLNNSITPDDVRTSERLTVAVADLLRDQVNMLVLDRSAGTGNLYYRAFLEASLPVPLVEAVDNGVIVSRRYVLNGETVTAATVGENVEVRLTIIAPTDLHYVLVQDPIPAGTDALDPNLNTSQQVGTQPEINLADPLSQGWGWWYFSNIEFRDEQVALSAEYLPAGTYEFVYTIRAGLPGVYNVIPPTAQEFYFPDVYGRGAGSTFTITAAP